MTNSFNKHQKKIREQKKKEKKTKKERRVERMIDGGYVWTGLWTKPEHKKRICKFAADLNKGELHDNE